MKGEALLKLKRYYEALTCFGEALELNPESYYAWAGRERAFQGLGRLEDSLFCSIKKAEFKREEFDEELKKGWELFHQEKFDASLVHFENAIACFERIRRKKNEDI